MKDCNHCGNLGYTIEVNADGEQYMDDCFACWLESQEAANLSPTGRTLDNNPPPQNLPVRTAMGRKIRTLILSKGVAYTFGGLS